MIQEPWIDILGRPRQTSVILEVLQVFVGKNSDEFPQFRGFYGFVDLEIDLEFIDQYILAVVELLVSGGYWLSHTNDKPSHESLYFDNSSDVVPFDDYLFLVDLCWIIDTLDDGIDVTLFGSIYWNLFWDFFIGLASIFGWWSWNICICEYFLSFSFLKTI